EVPPPFCCQAYIDKVPKKRLGLRRVTLTAGRSCPIVGGVPMRRELLCLGVLLLGAPGFSFAEGNKPAQTAVERGGKALYEHCFSPPILPVKAYDNAWKQWGLKEKPADYDRAFRDRYGLAKAFYGNAGLPVGLRLAKGPAGKGISNDCLICHAGSIAGQ